jgi:hypothetical protein
MGLQGMAVCPNQVAGKYKARQAHQAGKQEMFDARSVFK